MSSTAIPAHSSPRRSSPSPSPSPRVRPEQEVLATLRPLLSSPQFDPNHQNAAGDSLLMTAARSAHPSVVALLLSSAPTLRVDLSGPAGWTALRLAVRQGDKGIVVQLVGAGADVRGLREGLEGGRGGRGGGGGVEGRGWMVRDEDRWGLREAMEEGLRAYEGRLHALLSEAGATGDAFLPHELQRIIIAYLTAAP